MTAPDIYGNQQVYKPTNLVTSDKMLLRVGTLASGEEYLVQDVNIQYNRPVNRIFEIGSSNVYFAPSRAFGSATLRRIVGRKYITDIFGVTGRGIWTTDLYSGSAQDRTMTFMNMKTDGSSSIQYILTGCVIDGVGASTDANGLLVQETVSIQFASFSFGYGSASGEGGTVNTAINASLSGSGSGIGGNLGINTFGGSAIQQLSTNISAGSGGIGGSIAAAFGF